MGKFNKLNRNLFKYVVIFSEMLDKLYNVQRIGKSWVDTDRTFYKIAKIRS